MSKDYFVIHHKLYTHTPLFKNEFNHIIKITFVLTRTFDFPRIGCLTVMNVLLTSRTRGHFSFIVENTALVSSGGMSNRGCWKCVRAIQGADQSWGTRSIYLCRECNCDGSGRQGREYSNLSRWIGSFAMAVLCRLLNKVCCCPGSGTMVRGGGWGIGVRATERCRDWPRHIERQGERDVDRQGDRWRSQRSEDIGGWRRERVWDEHLRKSSSQSIPQRGSAVCCGWLIQCCTGQ